MLSLLGSIIFLMAYHYDEYMPYDRLDKDVQMMTDAGINVVRIADERRAEYLFLETETAKVYLSSLQTNRVNRRNNGSK